MIENLVIDINIHPCENEKSQSRSGINPCIKNGVLGVIPESTIFSYGTDP